MIGGSVGVGPELLLIVGVAVGLFVGVEVGRVVGVAVGPELEGGWVGEAFGGIVVVGFVVGVKVAEVGLTVYAPLVKLYANVFRDVSTI